MQKPQTGHLVPIRQGYIALVVSYNGKEIELEATPDQIRMMMMHREKSSDWAEVQPDPFGNTKKWLDEAFK